MWYGLMDVEIIQESTINVHLMEVPPGERIYHSLLMMSLTSGFVLGTLMKRLKHYDLLIGLYCFVSLGLLSLMAYPPAVLFYCANILMGVLTGGQFVVIKKTPAASLYAADLCGGALGMALCSTVLVPVFGIIAVAGGLCVLKVLTWFSHCS